MAIRSPITARFSLIDDRGASVTEDGFRGRFALVYFGFTNCKIVCPRSLAKLSAVLERTDPDATRIAALYITVDPDRDTPEVMHRYVSQFYPRFTGLTGTRERIDEAKRNFRVFAERRSDGAGDGYDVPHTSIAYLIDPAGRYRAHFVETADEETIVARLEAEIEEDQDRCAR